MLLRGLTALLLFTVVTGQHLSLVKEPLNVEANENQEVILTCQFSGPAKECVWLKDGELTIVREPYTYVGNPETGDCTIRINQLNPGRDDGSWQCQFPRVGSNSAVISPVAKVTVLVSPQDPVIFFDGDTVEKGGTLSLVRPNENITVICLSKNGNPAAQLYWMMDNRRMDGFSKNESAQSTGSIKLYNSESQLIFTAGSELRGTQIKCVAEHPTYHGVLHESYAYAQVHHNTTHVSSSVDGSFEYKIESEENKEVTMYCTADGIPFPSYTWQFQRKGEESWEIWGNQQNLTVKAIAGKYLCSAGNEYNLEEVRSPVEIIVETKALVTDTNNSGLTIRFNSLIYLVVICSLSQLFATY